MESVQLSFESKLPSSKHFGEEVLLIYDGVLEKKFGPWIRKFPRRYKVKSGEGLKSLEAFPRHIEKISALAGEASPKQLKILAFGGGSVGDFAGFVASIFKRGVGFVQIPSTWLAAIDSAHGGKTALNVKGFKNQVGTFYQAQEVCLVQEVLFSQPSARSYEAFAELIKIALLEGGELWQQVSQILDPQHDQLWKVLGLAIHAKYKVVSEDPFEESGYRHLLNLGHTMGHAFESVHKLPHGIAVNLGLHFSLLWSVKKGYMKPEALLDILHSPAGTWLADLEDYMQKKHFAAYEKALLRDKKKTSSSSVRFVYLQEPGRPLIETVTVKSILQALPQLDKII